MQYQWLILQDGSLPLRPDGRLTPDEHLCSAVLIWPADQPLTPANSLLVDPSFSESGLELARQRLAARRLGFEQIGAYFETHPHFDHVLHLPAGRVAGRVGGSVSPGAERWRCLTPWRTPDAIPGVEHPEILWALLGPSRPADRQPRLLSPALPALEQVALPGHEAELSAVRFPTSAGEVWVVGDAILDRQWLVAWRYYWPNGYGRSEILETWRSVAQILTTAEVVIPGHGAPFAVDHELVRQLLEGFARAEYADACGEVAERLTARLLRLPQQDAAG